MELTQARRIVNEGIGNLVLNNKNQLVDALNNNGFAVTYSDSNADIIFKTLQANQLSKDFRNELISLMAAQNYGVEQKTVGFAVQPDVTPHFTLNDLSMGTFTGTNNAPFTNSNTYSAADGTGGGLAGLFNAAVGIYSTNQLAESQKQTANAVLQHDQNQIMLQNQQLALSAQQASTVAAKMKAYILPIVVVGVLVIGGFIVYRKYKK